MFVTVEYAREMTVKKPCMCAAYRSFEHLLFLLNHCYDSKGKTWG